MKQSTIKTLLFSLVALSFIGCDQLTKDLAKTHLMHRESISYFHDTFRLEYVENTGAFMSFGANLPPTTSFWVFSIFPLFLMGVLFLYIVRNSATMDWRSLFALTLIFSGGLGNLIDRIFYDRHVTDFMNLGVSGIRTGIFNFADVYITLGVILALFFYRDKG